MEVAGTNSEHEDRNPKPIKLLANLECNQDVTEWQEAESVNRQIKRL